MPRYQVKCNCSSCISVEAASIEEAKHKLKEMMSPETVAAHCYDLHDADPKAVKKEEIDAMIDRDTHEVI